MNLPDEAQPTLSFANINVGGVGVLDGVVSSQNVNFRGVNSANSFIGVTLDNANHNILLTLDITAVANGLPAATTTQAGVLETATNAEAIAKAATDKILVPSNLAALGASQTFAGLIEIATNAETQAGASAVLAVSPAGLASLTATQKFTTTFADAVARAAAVPAFSGQVGTQLDSGQPYVAQSTVAGAWSPLMVFNANAIVPNGATNGLQLGTSTLDIADGSISFTNTAITYDLSTIEIQGNAAFRFSGCSVQFDGATVDIDGSSIAANSLVATSGVAGHLESRPVTNFISAYNQSTGWAVTNLVSTKTLDCSAATLGDLRNVVGTLLNALMGNLKPSS